MSEKDHQPPARDAGADKAQALKAAFDEAVSLVAEPLPAAVPPSFHPTAPGRRKPR